MTPYNFTQAQLTQIAADVQYYVRLGVEGADAAQYVAIQNRPAGVPAQPGDAALIERVERIVELELD